MQDLLEDGEVQPMPVTLVGESGISIAVADHHQPFLQARADDLINDLGARGTEEQYL
jgi:hypothetical protein